MIQTSIQQTILRLRQNPQDAGLIDDLLEVMTERVGEKSRSEHEAFAMGLHLGAACAFTLEDNTSMALDELEKMNILLGGDDDKGDG